MKRLSSRRRKWFRHRQRQEYKKKHRHLEYSRPISVSEHSTSAGLVTLYSPDGSWKARAVEGREIMPITLCFDENPVETLTAIGRVRESLSKLRKTPMLPGRKMRFRKPKRFGRYSDFTTIEKITPAAALVLVAEYERWTTRSAKKIVLADVHKWNDDVLDTLWRIGFFNIIGFSVVEPPNLEPDTLVLPMVSGDTANGEAVTGLMDALKSLFPLSNSNDAAGDGLVNLYGVMLDAIENVVGHAYNKAIQTEYPNIGKWWMTGALDRRAKRTTAVVYDQGISIPVSLPYWEKYGGVKRRMREFASAVGIEIDNEEGRTDGWAIEAAVEESATSTGEPNRGKGLARMKDFVDQCKDGYLRIISRRGEVIFRPGLKPIVRTQEVSIGGTLIEWNVLF